MYKHYKQQENNQDKKNFIDKNVRTMQQKTIVRIFKKIPRSYCNGL